MTRVEEYRWICEILLELKRYPEHNISVIDELYQIVHYREEKAIEQAMHTYKKNNNNNVNNLHFKNT